jgi:hypothetical protein
LYDHPTPALATAWPKRWYFWATHSRIANGLIEGINSLVQAAKAKTRGYRSVRNPKRWSI